MELLSRPFDDICQLTSQTPNYKIACSRKGSQEFLKSCREKRIQCVNVKNLDNDHFQILQSGELNGSILGSLLFYILINDSFLFIVNLRCKTLLTILQYQYFKDPYPFIDILLAKSLNTISWFQENKMIVIFRQISGYDCRQTKHDEKIYTFVIYSSLNLLLIY